MEFVKDIYCEEHRGYCCYEVRSCCSAFETFKICRYKYKNERDCYAAIYAHCVLNYFVDKNELKKKKVRHWEAWSDFYREYYVSVSQIPIQPVTDHRNVAVATNVLPFNEYLPLVRKLDVYLYQTLLGVKVPKVTGKIPSLIEMCMERLSIEQIIYNGYKGFPTAVYTTNYLGLDKQNRLLSEFYVNCTARGTPFQSVRAWMPSAVRRLEKLLGTDKFVSRLDFNYSPRMFVDLVKLTTSGGILSTPSGSTTVGGVRYNIKNSGSKIYLFEAAARQAHRIMCELRDGRYPTFMHLLVTKLKGEWKYGFEKKVEDLPDIQMKIREFFIPSLPFSMISYLLHKARMDLERGCWIKIGSSAYHGQWYEIAKYLNYDSKEVVWVDGDITALDKHIPDWALYVYIAAGSRYYNYKKMNKEQRAFMRRLYIYVMYHITNKITLQVGNVWRIIQGVMYSGGPETSHGDSWIMGLCFCLYISHLSEMYPHLVEFIDQCVSVGLIRFIVYGDDHIWCYPKVLRGLITADKFAEFLRRYCNMELRDFKEYSSFLSVVDMTTGVFLYRGPKFLKRYFVVNDFIQGGAAVLPYKSFLEPVVRMCTVNSTEGYLNALLKTYGHAWESYGTNMIVYKCAKFMYDQLVEKNVVKTPREMIRDIMLMDAGPKAMNDLVRRIGMTAEEIFDQFPPLELLQNRHIYNSDLCDYRKYYVYDDYSELITVKENKK